MGKDAHPTQGSGGIGVLLRNAVILVERILALEAKRHPAAILGGSGIEEARWQTVSTLAMRANDVIRKEFADLRLDNLGVRKLQSFLRRQYSDFRNGLARLFSSLATVLKAKPDAQTTAFKDLFREIWAIFNLVNADYLNLSRLVSSQLADRIHAPEDLVIDPDSPLLDPRGLRFNEFPSDLDRARDFARLVTKEAPLEEEDKRVLEEQVFELLKNAIRHGNELDKSKSVRIWYHFDMEKARVIVEDEGHGFKGIEKWNEFNRKRNHAIKNNDMETMMNYISYRDEKSQENDGGNALFAALEFWDSGLVYDEKRTRVAAMKFF
jgi:hypothetical protein